MSYNPIKKLALLTIKDGKVDRKIAEFALNNLKRKELILYIRTLEKVVYSQAVRIVSQEELSQKIKEEIGSLFGGRQVFFEKNSSIGVGIKAIVNDTIIDLSVKNYVENTLDRLKSTNR